MVLGVYFVNGFGGLLWKWFGGFAWEMVLGVNTGNNFGVCFVKGFEGSLWKWFGFFFLKVVYMGNGFWGLLSKWLWGFTWEMVAHWASQKL